VNLNEISHGSRRGKMKKIAVLPGDGIGPEVVAQALRVLDVLASAGLEFSLEEAPVGGAGYATHGHPLPPSTLALARSADAILFGAVGDWKYDTLDRELRPEQAILGLRRELGLFANLRPAVLYSGLASASPLKQEVVAGMDMMIVRELTGDVYFGRPRGRRAAPDGDFSGQREGYDTMRYAEGEIRRIAHVAFRTARTRRRKLCSVDKSNVLETFQLWREVVSEVGREYPDVELTHMYVDNAAMQLIRAPASFDVIVTGNLFGDILSDEASILTGSIGMLASASLNEQGRGLYEPGHGSAPDIAGKNIANPLATILSLGLMLRHSLGRADLAGMVESAVRAVLAQGLRTADIHAAGTRLVGTKEMGDAVLEYLVTALSR
jgi:3-isopropylmalate dehydrogenase